MSTLASAEARGPYVVDQGIPSHWHPASRPNVEETPIAGPASEPSKTQHHDAPEPEPNIEDHRYGFGAAVTSEVETESPRTSPHPDQVAQNQKPDARVASWSLQPPVLATFDRPEFPSDEDDERLDPAWGIKRTDSAQIFDNVNRSTSFPDFIAPLPSPNPATSTPLPHTQAEDLLQSPESREEQSENMSSISAGAVNDQDWARSAEDVQEPLLHPTSRGTIPTDREARFEEGLPLISADQEASLSPASEDGVGQLNARNPFENSHDNAEESFFDELAPTQHSPVLDRKTTADVLDSLDRVPNAPSDSPPLRPFEAENIPARDTKYADLHQPATQPPPEIDNKEDVDAMWQAALDDEEFLVDDPDDLLPDSVPDSPSSFTASLKKDPSQQPEPDEFLMHLHAETEQGVQRTPPSAGRESRPGFINHASSNPYAPSQPSTSDPAQLSPTTYGNLGITRPGLAPMNSFQQQLQQRPPPLPKTESFVDQSKGGYKSPYDLPLELSKPRKRPQIQQPPQPAKGVPHPPPRTSSISSDNQLQSPFSPTFPGGHGMPIVTTPIRPTYRSASIASPPKATSSTTSGSGTFFEELPMTSRPRPATGQGRYTPQQTGPVIPPQLLPQSPPSRPEQSSPPPPKTNPYDQYQLRAPEKMDPYANVPLQVPSAPTNPANSTRYSPAPVPAVGSIRPSPSPRYSPAPPPQAPSSNGNRYASQPPPIAAVAPPLARNVSQAQTNPLPPPSIMPFQPRTSSPLAYHGRTINEESEQPIHPHAIQSRVPPPASLHYQSHMPRISEASASQAAFPPSEMAINNTVGPPGDIAHPRRSQTQSPSKRGPIPSFMVPTNIEVPRASSVPGPTSPTRAAAAQTEIFPPARVSVRQRGLSQNFNFIEPTDGQQLDSLQRWKGAPLFRFAFGGSVISSFPKHIPRYAAGSAMPMIKPIAGEVHVRNATEVVPASDHILSFPGPLRSKSKKKEVLSWLASRISALEQEHLPGPFQPHLADLRKRHDEKLLLWRMVQALVEHDGILEGTVPQKSVSAVLSPEVHALDEATATQYGLGSDANGIYRPRGTSTHTETVDPAAVEALRKHLLRGEREKAVWLAVDKRLWAHAMIISYTLDRTVWKQVAQEFVRQEVKIIGVNTESLAAVYEVFAGNLEESIDELVPPSARAGLQMVSKVDSTGPTRNALDGLDRWRETLSLVLSNRTPGDSQAVAALGRLLMSYGRVEAAHICYLFARSPSQPTVLGGADDPHVGIVLLGADHQNQAFDFFRDEDAILLTEVYEFAVSILAGTPAMAMPHLQVYKLQRAASLADNGRKTEAQAYCDAIVGSFKSSTKLSPYYNPTFFAELEEFSSRLKQAPIQGSSSWIAKPSIEKVSGSVWNKFSSFVAGDDSDAESKGSGKDANYENGPFAKISGTPSLSRSGSSSDLYGNYSTGGPSSTLPNTIAGSRYAPNGTSTARSSSELTRGRGSLDLQRPPPSSGHSSISRPSPYEPSSFGQLSYMPSPTTTYQPLGQSPPRLRYQATPPQTSYMPSNTAQDSPQPTYIPQKPDSYIPTPPPEQVQASYMPTPPHISGAQASLSENPLFAGYPPSRGIDAEQPQPEPAATSSYDLPAHSFGYEPPADTGYVPYQPEADDEMDTEAKRPETTKKKSFMDDDDDDFPRIFNQNNSQALADSSSTLPAQDLDADARKRANDAAADAAFRAAAEADAARAEKEKNLKPKASGWFGGIGLFGGKKDPNSLDSAPAAKGGEPKVHRANLGESKMSLYYDEKLKKWVDPKNPDTLKPKAGPPPPPKMGGPGPVRNMTPVTSMPVTPSMGSGPPSGPPSRVATPGEGQGPPRGIATPPPPGGGLAPPSRPATGMSDASSIDDLLGPAVPGGGRKTVRGKKQAKGRYIDVMAK